MGLMIAQQKMDKCQVCFLDIVGLTKGLFGGPLIDLT